MHSCMEYSDLKDVENLNDNNIKDNVINEKDKIDVEKIETNIHNENEKFLNTHLKESNNFITKDNSKEDINEKNDKKSSLIAESFEEKKNEILKDKENLKYSDDEKETKDDANEKYNKGDYEGALKIWERGLRTINYILSKKEELKKERLQTFQKLHSTYCSNIAQGYMQLKKYSECVKYSLLAKENDNNIKIYFRLAKGYFMLGEYDKSIEILNEGIKINKHKSLSNLLALVKKKKHLHLEKEKYMMKYIFQSLKENPLTNNEENKNSFFKNIIYIIYSFLSFLLMFISIFRKNCSNLFYYTISKFKIKKE